MAIGQYMSKKKKKKKKRKYVNFYAFFLIAIFPFSLIAILCF